MSVKIKKVKPYVRNENILSNYIMQNTNFSKILRPDYFILSISKKGRKEQYKSVFYWPREIIQQNVRNICL